MSAFPSAPIDPSATRAARLGQLAAAVAFLVVLCSSVPSDLPAPARRVAAVAAAMAVLWLTQAVPLGATSLIPLAAFPLLGIQSAKDVSKSYVNESVVLYLGGFVIALGVERWGLHRRMALHVVRVVGCGPRRLVLGFGVATAFLSMWISNSAAAMLMVPIAAALLVSLDDLASRGRQPAGSDETVPLHPAAPRPTDAFGASLLLAVAYAASIGGMTTLVGTPTNLAFRQIYSDLFPAAPEISVGDWMISFVPLGVVLLLAMWAVLSVGLQPIPGAEAFGRVFFAERLRELGRPSPAERRMFAVFAATALLWLFRTPLRLGGPESAPLLPGWGPLVESQLLSLGVKADVAGKLVDDSTVAMLMATLLFFLPSGTRAVPDHSDDPSQAGRSRPTRPQAAGLGEEVAHSRANLMDWPTANRLPWEVLLLFGGGFALADGFAAAGLSQWVGGEFEAGFGGQPVWLMVAGTCLLMTFLTEFTSNTATCNIVCPILAAAAANLGTDPRLLMIAAALSASCAFMLPVATPPNAIIFASGRVTVGRMARRGFALNLIGVALVTAAVLWVYAPQSGIDRDRTPTWAAGK